MVEELAQRSTLVCPACLTAIDRIECLVQKQPDRPAGIYPCRTILVQRGCVPEHGKEVRDDKAKSRECDLAWMRQYLSQIRYIYR